MSKLKPRVTIIAVALCVLGVRVPVAHAVVLDSTDIGITVANTGLSGFVGLSRTSISI